MLARNGSHHVPVHRSVAARTPRRSVQPTVGRPRVHAGQTRARHQCSSFGFSRPSPRTFRQARLCWNRTAQAAVGQSAAASLPRPGNAGRCGTAGDDARYGNEAKCGPDLASVVGGPQAFSADVSADATTNVAWPQPGLKHNPDRTRQVREEARPAGQGSLLMLAPAVRDDSRAARVPRRAPCGPRARRRHRRAVATPQPAARTSMRSPNSRTSYRGCGLLAGPRTTPPSAKPNTLPCQGQVTPPSAIVPSSSGPPM
jgi:hypothetical protein